MGVVEEEYRRIGDSGWGVEFQKITEAARKYDYTFVEAKKPENVMHNRYMDICPYDHSRVTFEKSESDYINANVVKVESANKRYILTQGPNKASTPLFWRMVWEQNCKAIIMLNKRIENDRIKCSLYWPGNVGAEFATKFPSVDLVVEQLTEDSHTNYCTRIIRITEGQTNLSREVIQFHYVTWPDFGVPSSPTAFLDFLYAVRASGAMDPSVGPPVVHCSAGVGRSGTFCLVDTCLDMIKQFGEDNVDIQEILLEMRKYRMGLIQTSDQLRFSYQAIIKGINTDHTSTTNGNEEEEPALSISKEDTNDPPPVPPPRAASLKSEDHLNKNDVITNGTDSDATMNNYNPPMKELPDVPSDSESDESEGDVLIPENNSNDEESLPELPENEEDTKPPELPAKDGVRRRELQSEKTARLQEKIQDMKRKQQDAEKWHSKKRSLYIPMIIVSGVLICGAVSYLTYKNWHTIF